MKTIPIPEQVRVAARKVFNKCKRERCISWHQVENIPEMGIEAVTTNGALKAGLRVWIISGHERTVFLGESLTETKLPEFTILTDSGCQILAQYGRDFRFEEGAA